jgi:hypothetical protein
MSILQAGSMDAALVMVKDHHHLQWAEGCEIVVLEELPLPEMAPPPKGGMPSARDEPHAWDELRARSCRRDLRPLALGDADALALSPV